MLWSLLDEVNKLRDGTGDYRSDKYDLDRAAKDIVEASQNK